MISILSLLLVTATASPELEQVVARIQESYALRRDITANFTQTYVDSLSGTRRVEAGMLWAQSNGKVRWSYESPVKKDFIYDGSTAYFYEPDNAQVTVFERFEDSQLSRVVRFLWGQGDLLSTFDVTPCTTDCGVSSEDELLLALSPKQSIASIQRVVLAVNVRTARVERSIVYDPLGNFTEYALTDLRFDMAIDDKKFDFKVPDGVSVLRAAMTGKP